MDSIRHGLCRHILALFLIFFAAVAVAALYADDVIHTVKKGDTLYSLARQYGVKQDEILFINGLNDGASIKIGQKLKIPGSPMEVSAIGTKPAPSGGTQTVPSAQKTAMVTYQVQKGDTFFSIAKKYGTTEKEIRAASRLASNYALKAGDTLKIPTMVASSSSSVKTAGSVKGNWPIAAQSIASMTGKLPGLVLTGSKGEPVRSISSGRVVSAGPYRGFGRVAIVQSNGGYLYVYGGCESLAVKEGDIIYGSSTIGTLGIDAQSNRPQLFLMVYKNNKPIDPALAPRL